MEEGLLHKIQAAPESLKAKILVVSSVLAGICVVFVWLKFFNSIFTNDAVSETNNDFAVREAFLGGAANMYQNTVSGIGDLFRKISDPKEIIVEPKQ